MIPCPMIFMLPFTPLCAVAAAAVQARCFETAWEASAMAAVLDMPGAFGWLALLMQHHEPGRCHTGDEVRPVGVPAGLILCCRVLNEVEILTVGVVPQARRLGLGRRLLENVRTAGTTMFLEVAADNTAALALYRELCFKQVGRRPGYYQRAGRMAVDALVMQQL